MVNFNFERVVLLTIIATSTNKTQKGMNMGDYLYFVYVSNL